MSLFSRNAESVINEERKLMERSLAKMIGEIDKYKKNLGIKWVHYDSFYVANSFFHCNCCHG